MISLIGSIILLVIAYFVSRYNPFFAGLIAVIPIKIIGTALIANEVGGLVQAIQGMLIGQFAWGFILLLIYFYIK